LRRTSFPLVTHLTGWPHGDRRTEIPVGVTRARAAAATFEALLCELADDAPHWNATDILAVTDGEP